MPRKIVRRPRARLDLLEIWQYIAADNQRAADRILDRFDSVMAVLSDNPLAGRARPELGSQIHSFPVGNYVLFYQPLENGMELIRVLNGHRDIQSEMF